MQSENNEENKDCDDTFVCDECGKRFDHVPIIVWDGLEWEFQFCGKCFGDWNKRRGLDKTKMKGL